jgi:hypothetical protein
MINDTVLRVTPDNAVDAVTAMLDGKPLPAGAHEEDYDTFVARGRIENCTCHQISCVCAQVAGHNEGCRFRTAVLCPIPIDCEHGYDVCPQCDPCTCVVGDA